MLPSTSTTQYIRYIPITRLAHRLADRCAWHSCLLSTSIIDMFCWIQYACSTMTRLLQRLYRFSPASATSAERLRSSPVNYPDNRIPMSD